MDKETLEYVAGLLKAIAHYEERFRQLNTMLCSIACCNDAWKHVVKIDFYMSVEEERTMVCVRNICERLEDVELPA